jgi:hypothetical protein
MAGLAIAIGCISGFDGCIKNGTATITYHQVGSCNGWNDGTTLWSAGPNAAYVVFKVHTIDNTQGTVDFNFDPAKMTVFNGGSPRPHIDPGLSLAKFMGVFALVPTTVSKGTLLGLDGFAVAIVQTTNPNGAVEANQTTYSLSYDTGAADPGILYATDQTWVPLPKPTEDCTTITYK